MIFLYAIGSGFVALMLTIALNHLALRKWRQAANEHWTERARLLFPVRKGAIWNLILLTLISLFVADWLFGEEADFLWPRASIVFCNWLGVMFGSRSIAEEVFPWLAFRDWLRETTSTWLFIFFWYGTYFIVGYYMPSQLGPEVWVLFSLFLVYQLGLNWRGVMPLFKFLRIVKPAPQSLQEMVDRVSSRMNCKVKGVWIWQTSTVNAAAFPVTGELLFSARLLEKLPIEEQEAVCAHELGHLTESPGVVLSRLITSKTTTLVVLIKPAVNTYGLNGFLMVLLLWLAIAKFGIWVARKMEVRADNIAAGQEGGEVYARALEHIYELNLMPAVMRGKDKVHPHLYDRMLASGITPDYPRPKPPAQMSIATAGLLVAVVFLILATVIGGKKLNKTMQPVKSDMTSQVQNRSSSTDFTKGELS